MRARGARRVRGEQRGRRRDLDLDLRQAHGARARVETLDAQLQRVARRVVGRAADRDANLGALCVKGQFAYDYVHHPDRLKKPLVRREDGKLHETTWEEALQVAADGFRNVEQKYGRHAIYGVSSGRTPTEADYLMQKFIRAGFGTHNIDNCSRA